MKAKAPIDALTRVAQARAAADRSLAAWHTRATAWRERIARVPYWALLVGGFLGGAAMSRALPRTTLRRARRGAIATLGPIGLRALDLLLSWSAPRAAGPANRPSPQPPRES